MFIPIVIGGLSGAAYFVHRKRNTGMTPKRKKIFEAALKSPLPPDKLRDLAKGFEKAGLKNEAEILRKRASNQELPPETKDKRRDVFRKAMASTNTTGIKSVAAALQKEGALGAAKQLFEHAEGLVSTDPKKLENLAQRFQAKHPEAAANLRARIPAKTP